MDVQIQERPPEHLHAYAEAADVPGQVCDECGQVADDPLACMQCPRVMCSAHLPTYVYSRGGLCMDSDRAHDTTPERPDVCRACGAWFTAEEAPAERRRG